MSSSFPSWNCFIICVSGTDILCSSSIWIYSSRFSWYFRVDVKRCSLLTPCWSLIFDELSFSCTMSQLSGTLLVICCCIAKPPQTSWPKVAFFKAHGFRRSEIQTGCCKDSLFLLSYLGPWLGSMSNICKIGSFGIILTQITDACEIDAWAQLELLDPHMVSPGAYDP